MPLYAMAVCTWRFMCWAAVLGHSVGGWLLCHLPMQCGGPFLTDVRCVAVNHSLAVVSRLSSLRMVPYPSIAPYLPRHVEASTPAAAAASALLSRTTTAAATEAAAAAAAAANAAATANAAAALAAALSRRGVTLGAPLYAAQTAAAVQVPRVDGPAGAADGPLLWPLLVVYAVAGGGGHDNGGGGGDGGREVPRSDYLEAVSEDATVADILATVLPGGGNDSSAAALPWDTRRQYVTAASVDVLYRVGWTYTAGEGRAGGGGGGGVDNDDDDETEETRLGSDRGADVLGDWVQVPTGWTLRRLVGRPDYVVPLFPVLVVVPRGVRPR